MPGAEGVKGDPVNTRVPPVAASYQFTISPTPTVAVKTGMGEPAQYDAPAATGGFTGGQLQSGALIARVLSHPLATTVSVIDVPEGIPEMVQLFPPVLLTIPELELTVPPLTDTSTDHVNKSAEHVGPPEIERVGSGLTVTCTSSESIHPLSSVPVTR